MEEKILIQESGTEKKSKKFTRGFIVTTIFFILSVFYAVYTCFVWPSDFDAYLSLLISVFFGIYMIYLLLMYLFSKCQITVTNYRVYGKNIAGQVDLPLDSISSVKKGSFKSIGVASSSGLVKFYLVESRDKIFEEISSLLKQRQEPKTTKEDTATSSTDELKKFKELLDMGVITPEEFNAKKKQLLNL